MGEGKWRATHEQKLLTGQHKSKSSRIIKPKTRLSTVSVTVESLSVVKKEAFMQLLNDSATPLTKTSHTLGKNILAQLAKHYPGVKSGWTVTMKEGQGIVQVTNELLSGKMGFVMHVTKIDPELKNVMRAGGELLERYNVLRHPSLSLDTVMKDTRFNQVGQMEMVK